MSDPRPDPSAYPVDPDPQNDQPRRYGPRLIDLIGMVVGFGASALLIRSLWPTSRSMSPRVAVVAGLLHLWLGLAMAGPVLLLLDRRGLHDATRSMSWPQVSWLLIGSYWLVMTALLVPTRMAVHPLLGVLPIAAALLLRWLAPRSTRADPKPGMRTWTDPVALGLMVTWPLAWVALILLGKTLF